MLQKIIAFVIVCLFSDISHAQNYTQAVGIRGGLSSGITYRSHDSQYTANEFILKMKRREMNLTYLRIELEPNAFGNSEKLSMITGYGAHVGYKYGDRYNSIHGDIIFSNKNYYPVLGFDAIVGLEYLISEFPIIVGLDIKPFFEFSTKQIFRLYLPDIAFAIKYRF